MRAFIIRRDEGVCQICQELVIDSPEVHHIIELTADNYMNPEISLNPELLITTHKECHNKKHNRFCLLKNIIVDDNLNIDYSRR